MQNWKEVNVGSSAFFILRREGGGGGDMSHRNNEIDCKNMVTILRINFSLRRNWSLVRGEGGGGGGGWGTRAPTIPNETLSMHNK